MSYCTGKRSDEDDIYITIRKATLRSSVVILMGSRSARTTISVIPSVQLGGAAVLVGSKSYLKIFL